MGLIKIIIWTFFLAAISFFVYQDLKSEVVYYYDFSDGSTAFRKFWDQENNELEITGEGDKAFLRTVREISVFDLFFIDSPLEEFLDIEVRFKRSNGSDFLIGVKKSDFWADYARFSLNPSAGPANSSQTKPEQINKSDNDFVVGGVKNLRLTDYYIDSGRSLDFWLIAPGIEETGGEVLVDYIKITIRRDGISSESIAKSLPQPLYNFLKNSFYRTEK